MKTRYAMDQDLSVSDDSPAPCVLFCRISDEELSVSNGVVVCGPCCRISDEDLSASDDSLVPCFVCRIGDEDLTESNAVAPCSQCTFCGRISDEELTTLDAGPGYPCAAGCRVDA